MAVVTSDYLAGVLTNFRALYETDFQAALNVQGWRDIAVFMPSSGAENQYTWFGTVPKMKNVTHTQAAREGLSRYNFTIVNEEFQAMIEVERALLERDQLGLVRPRIAQLGLEAARHPGELILSLFASPGNSYDGAALFADTRVIGASANIDNIVTGTGVTVAAIQTDLATARGVMRLYQDDVGRPMNLVGNIIVCPVGLEQVFLQALNPQGAGSLAPQIVPATQNGTWSVNGYLVIPNPYLTDANDWYLLYNGGPMDRPFIFQQEKAPEMNGSTDPNSDAVIESRKFLYSVYGRYNVGVTDPRYIIRVTNT